MVSCQNGACVETGCNMGFADCNHNINDGCEVNIATDSNNCGACGNVCNLQNAQAACIGGKCVVAQCNVGFSNCDGIDLNGCEANTSSDINNCGGCNAKCAQVANATIGCSMSKCVITGCLNGFQNCNGLYNDGCESNVTSDPNNCGSCGKTCANTANVASTKCGNSACLVNTCNAGFADCNGLYGDGCEINTTSDANNCGGCAKPCQNGNVCVMSMCSANACDPNLEVSYMGHCYYLDGSTGMCDPGYALATQQLFPNIATLFGGKNYKHVVSQNCCIWNADVNENYGMSVHCNAPGPFAPNDVTLGGAGCTNQMNHFAGQLTFCGK